MVMASKGTTRRRLSHKGGTEVGRRAPSDTVPAWLTPNEFVEPVESTRMFGPLLEAMRQAGLQQRAMSGGGMVPPEQHGSHPAGYGGGGQVPDGADGYGVGGWVGHHAWAIPLALAAIATAPLWAPAAAGAGAAAVGSSGGFAGAAGTGGAAGAAGAAGAEGASLTGGSGLMGLASAHPAIARAAETLGMNKANSMLNPQQPAGDPAAAYYELRARSQQPQPRGYADGGDVYQWGAPTGNLRDPRTGPYGDLGHALQSFGSQGYFDPGGSQQAQEAMRAKALQDAQAFGRSAYLGADVGGLDQGAANAYRLTGLTNAGQGIGQGMVNYRANQAMSDQDWARHLFEMNFGEASNQLGRFFDYSNARNMPQRRG